jgi:predicted GNAT family acetyltransferase
MSSELQIRHEEVGDRGAFIVERDGERLGEQTYQRLGEHRIVIDHTEVSPALQGQGVARRLLDTAVAWARSTGTRVEATCPYARAQFLKDPSIQDIFER